MFQEHDGSFSWRRCLTFIAAIIFAISCIAYLFGARELPTTYIAVIAAVFAFYFTKDRLRK